MKPQLNSEITAIIASNTDGIINRFNEGAETLLGYPASEIIGLKNINYFLLKNEVDRFNKDISSKYEEGNSKLNPFSLLTLNNGYDSREWTITRKDGSVFVAHSTLTPITDQNGLSIGFLRIIKDITEQKAIENNLLEKNLELNNAEKITMMGHWRWDTITNDVKWSRNLYNIFEVNSEEKLTYETYFSFVHPDDKDEVTIAVEKTIKEIKFHDLLHRIKLRSGSVKTIQLLGEVITDDNGNVIELIGTCQDVTQQRMAEIKFKGLLESAPDAMVIVNEHGRIQLINKQAEKLFGYTSEEIFDNDVELLIPKKYTKTHHAHRSSFFKAPKRREMGKGRELYGVNKKGEEIPVQISLSPLETDEGLLVSAAIRDITEQKKAESKILNAKENLEKLAYKLTDQNKQLADFAHITSHNLRAPVSNLNALLDFYKNAETLEERTLLFEKFEVVISHLTQTLDTLIEALKIKNESAENLEVLSFDDVLNKTKEILSGQIIETKASITADFNEYPNIKYHKVYLESIFLNLINNALKYKSANRTPEIIIKSSINNGIQTLTIKDNGLGINLTRHNNKVFGLYKVFHRHPEAKGVGLFMTKVQIESLGGKINVESDVNVGSTFTINFNQ